MKQIRTFTLTALVTTVLFASCSKEKTTPNPDPAPSANEKLIVMSDEFYTGTIIDYYPDRKIKSYRYTPAGGSERLTEFSYNGNNVIKKQYYQGKLQGETNIVLNEKGYKKTSHYKMYDNNGVVVIENDADFLYDAAGHLIKEVFSTGAYLDYKYDVNGNHSETHYYENGAEVWRSSSTYFTDKKSKLVSYGYGNSNGDGTLMPLFSKNLLKHYITWDMTNQTKLFDGEYTYELDTDGFVKKGKYTNAVSGNSWEWTNTYQ